MHMSWEVLIQTKVAAVSWGDVVSCDPVICVVCAFSGGAQICTACFFLPLLPRLSLCREVSASVNTEETLPAPGGVAKGTPSPGSASARRAGGSQGQVGSLVAVRNPQGLCDATSLDTHRDRV